MKLHPRLTAAGVLLARSGERLRPRAERDAEGWVIGYGHRASAREGAQVSDDDALALLIYDLSQSAARVAPLLRRDTPDALFDALNALAFRTGPAAFARSDVLRRVNAGEAVGVAQVLAARDRAPGEAPSALLVAAEAVRDRLSHLLDHEPEPPRRIPRPAWPDAPADAPPEPQADADPSEAPERAAIPAIPAFAPWTLPPSRPADAPPAGVEAPSPAATTPEPEPEPEAGADAGVIGAEAAPAPRQDGGGEPTVAPDASWRRLELADLPPFDPPAGAAGGGAPHAPIVSFERGGRSRLWRRLRDDPNLYMALGACGLAMFLCAVWGMLHHLPVASGLGLGLLGLLCLAPAVAFFVARRRGG